MCIAVHCWRKIWRILLDDLGSGPWLLSGRSLFVSSLSLCSVFLSSSRLALVCLPLPHRRLQQTTLFCNSEPWALFQHFSLPPSRKSENRTEYHRPVWSRAELQRAVYAVSFWGKLNFKFTDHETVLPVSIRKVIQNVVRPGSLWFAQVT